MMKLMAPWEGQNVEMMIMGIEFYSGCPAAGKVREKGAGRRGAAVMQ